MSSPAEPAKPTPPAPAGIPAPLLSRQVHVVMGKGGVGRSTVALALALGLWRQGRRVLLAQVHAPDAHGPLLGVPVGEELTLVRDGLTAVDVDPRAALREYVMMMVKFRRLFDAVFDNKLATYFLRFIPSLAEVNMLGKLWFHAEEQQRGRLRFEHVVIDAPATGHGLTFIKVARVVSRTAPPGALRTQTEAMAALLEDPARSAVHVVTTPDELSVQEAEELVARLREGGVAPLGVAILNRAPDQLFAGIEADPAPALARDEALRPLARVVQQRHQWERAARAASARLRATGLPTVELAEAPAEEFTLADAERMGAVLAGREVAP